MLLLANVSHGLRTPWSRLRVALDLAIERGDERFEAAHPGRRLKVELPSSMPDVEVDAMLVRRALGNLLEDAARYSEADQPILLRAGAGDGRLVVEIVDRGVGIEEPDLPYVFEPFFRADLPRSTAAGAAPRAASGSASCSRSGSRRRTAAT